MGIELIDKNFKPCSISSTDLTWYNGNESPFSAYGIYYDKQQNSFLRYPLEEGRKIGTGYLVYADATCSGRIRFATNSDKLALHVEAKIADGVLPTASFLNYYGVSIYCNNRFVGKVMPQPKDVIEVANKKGFDFFAGPVTAELRMKEFAEEKNRVVFEGEINLNTKDKIKEITLFLPLYGGVKQIMVGIKNGCKVMQPVPYKYKKYVAFYGSSVTQGGCCSRPGLDYISWLSRMLDTDVYNFGLTGSAKGEKSACEFLAKLDPSVYFIDYDHNSETTQTLEQTHYPVYQTIRKAHPNTPIIFASRVGAGYYPDEYEQRINVIKNTVDKAIKNGDDNVYFIDGSKIFPPEIEGDCTIDCCHPNDLGFKLMADAFYPTLKEILDKIQ